MTRLGSLLLLGASLTFIGCDSSNTPPPNVPVTPVAPPEQPNPNAKKTIEPISPSTKAL